MANYGKFIDRSPKVKPAGLKSRLSYLEDCLNHHSFDDFLVCVLPRGGAGAAQAGGGDSLSPPNPHLRGGYHTRMKASMEWEKGGLLDELLTEFQASAPKKGLPDGMDPLIATFGKPTGVANGFDSVDEVVFPRVPYGEVKLGEQLGLELYQKSHNRFLVGQHKDLNYEAPKNVSYGKIERKDLAGLQTKKCLQWYNQEIVCRTSKGQARLRERTHYEIGKALAPNNILSKVGESFTFGSVTHFDDTGAREGTRLGPVDKSAQVNAEYIGFVCRIREDIKRWRPPFPFFELVNNLKLLDETGCGCLPLSTVYEACERLGLHFDRELFGVVPHYLGMVHGERNDILSYHGFSNLLDFRQPLPHFKKVNDLPEYLKLYESCYQALTKDLEKKKQLETVRRGGVPRLRTDRSLPGDAGCGGDRFLLSDETRVDACIRPSIFSFYGLTPRDFFQARTKEYLTDLWKRVGLEIPDNIFEEMWKEGLRRPENDGKSVCIETFRNMLDEMCEAKLVEQKGEDVFIVGEDIDLLVLMAAYEHPEPITDIFLLKPGKGKHSIFL